LEDLLLVRNSTAEQSFVPQTSVFVGLLMNYSPGRIVDYLLSMECPIGTPTAGLPLGFDFSRGREGKDVRSSFQSHRIVILVVVPTSVRTLA